MAERGLEGKERVWGDPGVQGSGGRMPPTPRPNPSLMLKPRQPPPPRCFGPAGPLPAGPGAFSCPLPLTRPLPRMVQAAAYSVGTQPLETENREYRRAPRPRSLPGASRPAADTCPPGPLQGHPHVSPLRAAWAAAPPTSRPLAQSQPPTQSPLHLCELLSQTTGGREASPPT